jgi:hypothetical protein
MGLKGIASRFPSMVSPVYKISFKCPSRFKRYWRGHTDTHTDTGIQAGDLIGKLHFWIEAKKVCSNQYYSLFYKSSWEYFFDVTTIMLIIVILPCILNYDRLCGLVVSVANYKHRGPGFDSRALLRIFLRVLGLERGPLSLVIG